MSIISAHRLLRSARRRVVLAVAVVVVGGALVAHHGMPTDMHAMPAAAMCLAVIGTAVAAAGIALLVDLGRLARPMAVLWVLHPAPVSAPRSAPVRAGPLFVVLQVLRR
jgi:drug/metabolite transporter (DMT)-like permease